LPWLKRKNLDQWPFILSLAPNKVGGFKERATTCVLLMPIKVRLRETVRYFLIYLPGKKLSKKQPTTISSCFKPGTFLMSRVPVSVRCFQEKAKEKPPMET